MATSPEKLEEIKVTAVRKYGRPYHMLTDEEKDALATAFQADRDQLDADYIAAYGMMEDGLQGGEMIQTGDLHHANWGDALGGAVKTGVGAYNMKKAREGKEALSVKEKMARRAAADVGANAQGQQMSMNQQLMEALKRQQQGGGQGGAPGQGGGMPPQAQGAPQGGPPAGMPPQMPNGPLRPGQPGAPEPMFAPPGAQLPPQAPPQAPPQGMPQGGPPMRPQGGPPPAPPQPLVGGSPQETTERSMQAMLGPQLMEMLRKRRLRGG